MLSGVKNFVYRHKKKFLVSGMVIGGAFLATKYTQKKLIEWQEQETKDFLAKTRKEQHFRSTERTCNETICSLAKTLKETITKIIDTDDLLNKIRYCDSNNKVPLWEEMEVLVFAQLSSLLYSGLMLVLILRIQLNVIGGYMFKEKLDLQDTFSSTFQENYLSLCHYFLNKGVKDICALMETHSRLVLKNIPLKKKLSLQDIEHIFWAIQSSLNNDPVDPLKNLSKYLLPPFCNDVIKNQGVDSKKMKLILDETFDILDSEEVTAIADSCIKRAYSNIVDQIASMYYSMSSLNMNSSYFGQQSDQEDDFKNLTKVVVPMAKIIPVIHGICKESTEINGDLTTWIHQFLIMDNINTLGANLHDAFSQGY